MLDLGRKTLEVVERNLRKRELIQFVVKTDKGLIMDIVPAWVFGPLCLHVCVEHKEMWRVSHIATGAWVCAHKDKVAAVRLARELSQLPGWDEGGTVRELMERMKAEVERILWYKR
jgi:hypothetical protein